MYTESQTTTLLVRGMYTVSEEERAVAARGSRGGGASQAARLREDGFQSRLQRYRLDSDESD